MTLWWKTYYTESLIHELYDLLRDYQRNIETLHDPKSRQEPIQQSVVVDFVFFVRESP